MADIISRLLQLTGTSPRLVIVGCDKVSQQQQLQNQYLSRQDEKVEVSFFAADQHMSTAEFRKMIFQQLTQKEATDYRLELKELFKRQLPRNQTNVLCITQSDNLPDQFVAELWEWISSIETGQSKDKINILLFASQAWGEVKRQWLDKQGDSSPVMISAASVDAVGFDVNELEKLMAEQRAFFAKNGLFDNRKPTSKLIQNGWFRGSIAGVFLVSFIGILAAQYSGQLMALSMGEQSMGDQEVNTATMELDGNQNLTSSTRELTASNVLAEIDMVPVEQTKLDEINEQAAPVGNEKYASVTSEILAGRWQDEKQNDETKTSNRDEKPLTDFQVPDIISVSQLDEKLDGLAATTRSLQNGGAGISSNVEAAPQEPVQAAAPAPVRTRQFGEYEFDEEFLLQLPNNQVVLQLSGMRDISILNTFLENNTLNSDIWIYRTELNGGDWYVVLHGDTFNTSNAARAMMPSLRNSLFDNRPFTKTIAQIRYEITGFN